MSPNFLSVQIEMFTVLNSIQTKNLKTKTNKRIINETNKEFDTRKLNLSKFSIYDYLDDQEGSNQNKCISLEKNFQMKTVNDVSILKQIFLFKLFFIVGFHIIL